MSHVCVCERLCVCARLAVVMRLRCSLCLYLCFTLEERCFAVAERLARPNCLCLIVVVRLWISLRRCLCFTVVERLCGPMCLCLTVVMGLWGSLWL